MEKGKVSIRFFIRTPDSQGIANVHVRLTHLRKKVDVSVGERVKASDWNSTIDRAKKDDKLNYHLDKLYDHLIEQRREMLRQDLPVSVISLKEKLLEKLGAT